MTPETSPLTANDEVVAQLSRAIRTGGYGLKDVPALLKVVIRDGMWQDRVIRQTGQAQHFERFADFVAMPPVEGLGADIPTLKRLCAGDSEAIDALDQATAGRQGARTDLVNNIKEVTRSPEGTSAQYAIRRLRQQRPDLHGRVLSGELSPHAAMIAAGFRERMVSVPPTVDGLLRTAQRHLSPSDRAELARLLADA
jgi:hypothetical protein